MIEFLPWYGPGEGFTRCSGCGSLVMLGDQETHVKWHEDVKAAFDSFAKAFEQYGKSVKQAFDAVGKVLRKEQRR